RTVLVTDLAQASRNELERLVPACLTELARLAVTDERLAQAIVAVAELMREASLHAGMAEVGAAFRVGLDVDDRAVLDVDVQRADDAELGAGRADGRIRQPMHARLRFLERGDGALEHALSAAHAVGLLEACVVAGDDARVVAASFHAEDERALHL